MRGSGIFHAVFLYPAAPIPEGGLAPSGHFLRRLSQCRFRLSPGDARGEAPCIRKLKTPPSPEGKGGGGMGAEKQAKNRVGRRQGRHAPLRALAPQAQPMPLPAQPRDARGEAPCIRKLKLPPSRREGGWEDGGRKASQKQGWQATRKARPSPGNGKARSASEAENSFKSPPAHPCPRRALAPQVQPMPLPAQPRGCKGRSPLHKKTKNSPFPPGRGAGGWGQKSKQKAGLAGDKEGTPPAGQRQGKVSQRGEELFQESPGASPPQKRRRRSASDRGSPTAHRSAQCGGKSWR